MCVVRTQVVIEGLMEDVFECSGDFDLLCAFNPNVKNVEVRKLNDKVQRYKIEEEFSGALCGYVVERTITSPTEILYRETTPLRFLRSHEVSWKFRPQGKYVLVEAEERFDVDMDQAVRLLPLGAQPEEDVGKMLSFSTLEMLRNLKAYVELLQQPLAVV